MRDQREENNTPLLDLLFITLLFLFLLIGIIIIHVNPEAKEADIETKAEYVISLTWDRIDDVDIWVEDPLGNILYYRNKDPGLMHLDRDDLGNVNDRITLGDGTVVYVDQNQELVTIRGFIAGEWTINVHMFKKKSEEATKVKVRMDKLNPVAKAVLLRKYVMNEQWQEITVTRFTMTEKGSILNWSALPKKLIKDKVEERVINNSEGGVP
jgi:hypothetical protein